MGGEAGNQSQEEPGCASGEELGEQERQAEVQQGHGSHHQGVGSSLQRQRVKWVQSLKPTARSHLHVLALVTRPKGPRNLPAQVRAEEPTPISDYGAPPFFLHGGPVFLHRAPPSHWEDRQQRFLPPPTPTPSALPHPQQSMWAKQKVPGLRSRHWQQQRPVLQ